jgi:hypothetical protein
LVHEHPRPCAASTRGAASERLPKLGQLVQRRHVILGLAVALVLCGIVATALYADPNRSVYPVVLFLCGMAGVGAALAAAGIGAANDEIHAKGDCFRAAVEIVTRARDVLFDNPVLSACDPIRRALLPTDRELVALQVSVSLATMLREFREGRHSFMQGGHRGGTRYFLSDRRAGPVGTASARPSNHQPEVEP